MTGIEWEQLWNLAAPDCHAKRSKGIYRYCGPANIAYKAKLIPEGSSLLASLTKAQK